MALQLLHGQLFETPPVPTRDLTGQTIIVTGANSGLGLDAAKHLYRLNCSHIILACRDVSKGEKAKSEIIASQSRTQAAANSTQPEISVWRLDMASYASVRDFASQAAALPRLDGAVLNAGVSLTNFTLSEGLETVLTVNVTATFLLTILLIPILRKSSESSSTTGSPRLTIVGSAVQHFAKHDQLTSAAPKDTNSPHAIFKNLSDPKTAKMADRYFLSKLLVMLLTVHLAKLMRPSVQAGPSVILNCIGPGYCYTALFRHQDSTFQRVSLRLIGRPCEEGSRTLVHGVTEAGVETHGRYVSECQVKTMSAYVRSERGKRIGALLWDEVVSIAEGVVPGCTSRI